MVVAQRSNPVITAADRLGLTLFFAVVFHAVVILGVGFDFNDFSDPNSLMQKLEITLVHRKSETPPDKADYLAQANHQGSGNIKKKVKPTAPRSQPVMMNSPANQGSAARKQERATRQRRKNPETRVQVLTQKTSSTRLATRQASQRRPAPKKLTAAELYRRSMETASLQAEYDQRRQAYAERPRHNYISASTQEYRYASYMEAWRMKVERIGHLNYPEEAKRLRLSGSLRLSVALKPDGTIYSITLRKSSGKKILDDAAIRIVRLAAPFAPFPDDIRKQTDILHIQRTWNFTSGNRLYTK